MAHLRLFGGASLEDDAGPICGPPAQRHRLALLAVLAVHHPGGVSRARLMELLWPGRGVAPARNLLNQAVHQLRKALGARAIRSVGVELRLDPDHLTSDLLLFRDAVGRDDLVLASRLASGPFLDGFALPESPGFERWAAGERTRLTERLADVLGRLATVELAAGDSATAVDLCRRRVALRPGDARAVLRLMHTLAEGGDRAAALQAGDAHARWLRDELGASPDPGVEALADRLRSGEGRTLERGREPVTAEPASGPRGALPGAAAVAPRSPGSEPRMVGRRDERERLERAWREAARGEAGLALITGEAGIGKSRLANELVRWAEKRGVLTARARSCAAEGRLAYGPVAEWLRSAPLRSAVESIGAPWRADLAALLPELAGPGAEATKSPEGVAPTTDGLRRRFFRALAGAVLGRGEPRMLLIDDLQWCDPDTLEWLHFLLRFDPAAPLLVLGTARSEEIGSHRPLRRLLSELRGGDGPTLTELELAPLRPEETATLGGALTGRELDGDERTRLYRETEGHPLFVVEGIRAGVLCAPTTRTADGGGSLAARVSSVIRTRLEQLSPEARTVAGVAATVGRAFGAEVLVGASHLDPTTVADALDELVERRIVRVSGDGFDFTHDKLREVVYGGLNPVRRRLLHERVATAIEDAAGIDVDAAAGVLASHRERAGDVASAVALCRKAAERARAMHGHEEAASYLRRALGSLESLAFPDEEERDRLELRLQYELGDSLLRTRGWAAPEVAVVHERELELAERLGDRRSLCRALWGLQSVRMVRAELTLARSLGVRLRTAAREAGDGLHLAAGHFVIGFASTMMGAGEEGIGQLERGIARYETLPDRDEARPLKTDLGILLLCAASHAAWFLGDEERALVRERQARAFARRAENPFARSAALTYGALLQQYRRDPVPAEEMADRAVAEAEEPGFLHYLASARMVKGWAMSERGDPGAGMGEIRSALETYDAIGSVLRKPYFLGLAAEVCLRLGRPDRARAHVGEALALCETTGERWYEPELRRQQTAVSARSP